MKIGAAAASMLVGVTAASAQPPGPRASLANPASVYCASLGGRSIIRQSPEGGQAGYCLIDEWRLFRATHGGGYGRAGPRG